MVVSIDWCTDMNPVASQLQSGEFGVNILHSFK